MDVISKIIDGIVGRLSPLIIFIALFAVSCRSVNTTPDASPAETVPSNDVVSLICGTQRNCLSTLCADAGKCPIKLALSNKAIFDFVKTYSECEGCNTQAFTPEKGIGKCIEYATTDDLHSWTVTFWVSDQCDFRYADPTQASISVEVSKETLTTERMTPAIETITDPLYCKNNSDCRCLAGSGVPFIGCSNFLYAPLNWSGHYAATDCICKAHQCIQK